jgi:hypothetical protein
MARDYYETTIALPDIAAGNAMKPLSGVKVSVVPRGATDIPNSLIDIFPADTGLTKGPDPKSGASGTNPFTTGASGAVRFWAEGPAELDIVFEDLTVPARITDRIGWNCIPAKSGSIPTAYLALDGGIKQLHLSAEVVMQQVPIGGVIDWWRSASGVALPAGYEIADARSVQYETAPAAPGVAAVLATVTLPNLQNAFIVGATTTKPDGTGADANNTPGGAPGIRGTGGSNAPKNFAHGHGVAGVDHLHLCHSADHTHASGGLYTGGHSHAVGTSATGYYVAHYVAAGGATQIANRDHTHSGWTDAPGNLGVGGNTAGADRSLDAWSGASDRSLNTGTYNTTWTADPGTEFRPYFYGLLKLIKVRRTA